MVEQRPNPDELLRRVVDEEARAKRGKLTIFFGAAPGVGKTYAMLEVARSEMEREKRDVVVGIVETHGRYETGALLLGLELLPRRKLTYRGLGIEGQETRVFDKFYTTVREGSHGGVGLGLAICRAIVAAHGGRIWTRNREGGGASFRFALPLEGSPPDLALPEGFDELPEQLSL